MNQIDLLSNRLKIIMNERGINQTTLSNMTGISRSMISEYLSNKYLPKQDNIYLLSEALKVSPGWLMGYDVNRNDISSLSNLDNTNKVDKLVSKIKSLNDKGLSKLDEYLEDLLKIYKK